MWRWLTGGVTPKVRARRPYCECQHPTRNISSPHGLQMSAVREVERVTFNWHTSSLFMFSANLSVSRLQINPSPWAWSPSELLAGRLWHPISPPSPVMGHSSCSCLCYGPSTCSHLFSVFQGEMSHLLVVLAPYPCCLPDLCVCCWTLSARSGRHGTWTHAPRPAFGRFDRLPLMLKCPISLVLA